MNIPPEKIILLMKALARKTGQALDYSGFNMMSYAMEKAEYNGVSQRYLYENIWRAATNAQEEGRKSIRPSLAKLDSIASFLGFADFYHFLNEEGLQLLPALKACLGTWKSYARHNSGKPFLLISLVQITQEESSVFMTLHGVDRKLKGELFVKNGCLYTTLSSSDKVLSLVLKIGKSQNPSLLQGVFSSISTSGEPIAGREVLMRENNPDASTPENKMLDLREENADVPKEILQYFDDFKENYVRINPSASFDLNDLIDF